MHNDPSSRQGTPRQTIATSWKRALLISVCAPIVSIIILLMLVGVINLAYPNDPGAGYILLFALIVLVPITIFCILVFGVIGCVGYARSRHLPNEPVPLIDAESIREGAEPAAAGFWRRSAAAIIDWFSLSLASVMIGYIVEALWLLAYSVPHDRQENVFDNAYAATVVALPWLYFTVFESARMQGTFGKIIFGISVTDLDGKRVSFARANARYWAKLLSVIPFLTGYFICAVTRRHQALHDMLARCLVVRRSTRSE